MKEVILKPTEQQIEEWKTKYKAVHEFGTPDGESVWLARPTRDMLRAANAGAGDDSIRWNEILLKNIFLAGDPKWLDDDEYFLGLSAQLGDVVSKKQVELKKTY